LQTKPFIRTFTFCTVTQDILSDCGVRFIAMDVTAVIVKNADLHEPLSLTLVLSSSASFTQRKPDGALLYVVDYLAHRSNHNGTCTVLEVAIARAIVCHFVLVLIALMSY